MTKYCTIRRPNYAAPTATEFEVVKENAFTLEVKRAEAGHNDWNPVFTLPIAHVWLEWERDDAGELVSEIDPEEMDRRDNMYPGSM
jgi:hypothetical protein